MAASQICYDRNGIIQQSRDAQDDSPELAKVCSYDIVLRWYIAHPLVIVSPLLDAVSGYRLSVPRCKKQRHPV